MSQTTSYVPPTAPRSSVDIKPDKLITAADRLNFAATAALGRQAGWAYRRLGESPSVLSANLRWLAGYRHKRVRDPIIAGMLLLSPRVGKRRPRCRWS